MFSHLKRRIGVLTAVAVLAALVPTLSISPASAAANVLTATAIDDAATYKACPTGSAAAAGFTDTTSTDVDCIAMYGITTGATATTYEPTASIPRWQMALYLTRFMTEAGYTLGSGADQGFTDISGESAAIQTAINQIKQAGVTNGTTATTYSPADNVSREEMAMFIERALSLITPGPGGNSEGASIGVDGALANLGLYNYTDIDSGVTFEGHNAIVELYHLGVTGDTAAVGNTYRPLVDITRAEMATFITNAAGHTNLRPSGVWIQSSLLSGFGVLDNALHISNRDSSFDAVQGTLIDVFEDKTAAETDPFAASGACTAHTTGIGGATKCGIALGDASTDTSGNVAIAVGGVTDVADGSTMTYWAWTGAVGASYDNDTPANSAVVTSSTAATTLVITNDISTNNIFDTTNNYTTNELVKYGTTVTVSGQLKTALLAAVADATAKIVITEETSTLTDDGDDSDGVATAQISAYTTTTVFTDANGAFTYTVTQADPSALTTNLNRTQTKLTFTLTHASATISSAALNLSWDDNPGIVEAGTVHALVLNKYYGAGSAAGISRTATATVYDQYGVGKSGETVTFASADNSFANNIARTTSSAGVATMGWTDILTTNVADTITATHGVAANPTKTYYRTVTQVADVAEIDTGSATEVGGEGKTFLTDGAGAWTFAENHGLVPGDQFVISAAPAGGDATEGIGATFFVLTTDGTTGMTVSRTRGGVANLESAALGGNAPGDGEAQPLGVADFAGDVLMELVVDDSANDILVINHLAGVNATSTFVTFAYDSNDQFQTLADASLTGTAVTQTAFETAVTGKFTLGVPDPAEKGDVVSLSYQALTTGIQILRLGQ